MYTVVNAFRDKQDGNRLYKKGDIYPAPGVKASKARIKFLCEENPETGDVYLEEVLQTPGEGDENEAGGAEGNEGGQLPPPGEGDE